MRGLSEAARLELVLVMLERLGLQSFAAGVLGAPAHAVVLAQSGVPKSETVAASALSQERL